MLRAIGLPQLFVIFLVWGLSIFCVWTFYQTLSKINDNIGGIRQAVERNDTTRPIHAGLMSESTKESSSADRYQDCWTRLRGSGYGHCNIISSRDTHRNLNVDLI
jgi:hypothetical protein